MVSFGSPEHILSLLLTFAHLLSLSSHTRPHNFREGSSMVPQSHAILQRVSPILQMWISARCKHICEGCPPNTHTHTHTLRGGAPSDSVRGMIGICTDAIDIIVQQSRRLIIGFVLVRVATQHTRPSAAPPFPPTHTRDTPLTYEIAIRVWHGTRARSVARGERVSVS